MERGNTSLLLTLRIRQKQRFGIFRGVFMKQINTSLHSYIFPNINEDGWKFVSVLAIFTLLSFTIWLPFGLFSLIITVLCYYSFRTPVRITPVLSDAVIAPVDGRIISINKEKGPDVLGLAGKNFTKIRIFCSLFDVNICHAPIKGKITKLFYDQGKPFNRSFDVANINNERLLFLMKHSQNKDFVIQNIAPFCSKRIVSAIKNGDELPAGKSYGFTRFGGYIDLYLPEKTEAQVCVGQTMIGGETIVANINSDAPRILGEIR